MKLFCYLVLSLLIYAFGTGCYSKAREQEQYSALLDRAAELEHRHCRLDASIDSLWDVTSHKLDQAMPATFPSIDRDIFLKARNADHIRMFMSFQKLTPEAQNLVDEAGKYDAQLAGQVRSLLQQKQAFEKEKMQFLKEAKQNGATGIYAETLRKVASTSCK